MIESLLADVDPEAVAAAERGKPLGRFARPAEVAAVIHHLLSPAASYTNGLAYAVDAGGLAGRIEDL
jgi:NAD(P)-dependent dehydrogenase (short-subunit alcohol dehydrogenase family)